MPMIYKRFTDKTAEEWRQIYKVCDTLYELTLETDDSQVATTARIFDQEWFGKSC